MKKNNHIQREPRRPQDTKETKYITLSMDKYNEIIRENAVLLEQKKLLLSGEYGLEKALKKEGEE